LGFPPVEPENSPPISFCYFMCKTYNLKTLP
jgi:hypothetical protein